MDRVVFAVAANEVRRMVPTRERRVERKVRQVPQDGESRRRAQDGHVLGLAHVRIAHPRRTVRISRAVHVAPVSLRPLEAIEVNVEEQKVATDKPPRTVDGRDARSGHKEAPLHRTKSHGQKKQSDPIPMEGIYINPKAELILVGANASDYDVYIANDVATATLSTNRTVTLRGRTGLYNGEDCIPWEGGDK